MAYPPQQGQNPYPGMPQYPAGGYPASVQAPSGGTAITAGVLAILGAVWAIIAAILNVSATSALAGSSLLGWVWVQVIVFVIELFTLGPGAILLLTRRPQGRVLIAIGCVLHILQGIVGAVIILGDTGTTLSGGANSAMIGGGVIGVFIALAPAIATLILVSVPLTGRWVGWRTAQLPNANPEWN